MVGHSAVTRYIADGFQEDADALLHKFFELQSYEYDDFARLWREAMFSLVYMGRQSVDELREFTQECFKITLSYLSTNTSLRLKIGAVYLLYGLYLKQPLEKYKIRIQLPQWQEMSALYDFGMKENQLGIPFVIDKLLSLNAFHFVALPRLMGPLVTVTSEPASVSEGRLENLKSCMKEFIEGNDLQEMHDLQEKYEKEKAKLGVKDDDLNSLLPNKYLEISKEFEDLVNKKWDDQPRIPKSLSAEGDDLGSRRASLKQKQYRKTAAGDLVKRRDELLGTVSAGDDYEDDESLDYLLPASALTDSEVSAKEKKLKRRRQPKPLRKPGRPKKVIKEEEEAASASAESDKMQVSFKEEDDDSEFEGFVGIDYNTYMKLQKPEGRQRRPKPRKSKYHFAADSDDEEDAV